MTTHVAELLQKEVSRKEFLGMSGLAVASIFGLGTVVKLLTGKSLSGSAGKQISMNAGFGSGAYGGIKDARH
jgi:hypothetical protein